MSGGVLSPGTSVALYDISAGVPAVSNWTWFNQGSATATDSSPTGKAIYLVGQGGTHNTTALRGLYKAVPSTPYTVTGLLIHNSLSIVSYAQFFMGWTDGTKVQAIALAGSDALTTPLTIVVQSYSNSTTFNSGQGTNIPTSFLAPVFFQLTDDGTNVAFKFGTDGVNFVTQYSVAKASGYLGSGGYTNLIWGISDVNAASTTALTATLRLWDTGTRSFP